MEPLLEDIAAFIKQHGITERRLGELALNDTKFVSDIRDGGRSPSLRTVEKLRQFMDAYASQGRDIAA